MPRVPARHVGRPRLLALLDAAEPGGLLLVSAPAGYGKTLLLAEWAARRPDRVAWLSLDDDDSTAPRFWSAVLAALCGCAGVPPSSAVRRLAAPLFGETGSGFLLGLRAALDELAAPVDLVLDDLHALPPGSTAMRALAALVRERPPRAAARARDAHRPASAGRAPAPVGRAARDPRTGPGVLHRRGRRAAAGAATVALAPEQVRTLVDETAGWAAGLRLAALSLREAPDTERFLADLVGNSKATSDYLVGEILSALPSDTPTCCAPSASATDSPRGSRRRSPTGRTPVRCWRAGAGDLAGPELRRGPGPVPRPPAAALASALDLQRRPPEMIAAPARAAADWFAAHGHPDAALRTPGRPATAPGWRRCWSRRDWARRGRGARRGARRPGLPRRRAAAVDPFVALLGALRERGLRSRLVDRHRGRRTWPDDPARVGGVARPGPVPAGRRGSDHGPIAARGLAPRGAGRRGDRAGRAGARPARRGSEAAPARDGVARRRPAARPRLPRRPRDERARPGRRGGGEYRRMAELADGRRRRAHARGLAGDRGCGAPALLGAYGALLDLRPERCLDLLAAAPRRPGRSPCSAPGARRCARPP